MSKQGAIKAMGIILSSYPSANKDGIENFYRLATESLEGYPDRVLEELADLKIGIVTKSTFIPSISELRMFCDRIWERVSPQRNVSWEAPAMLLEATAEEQAAREAHRKMMKQKFQDLQVEMRMAPDPWIGHGAARAKYDDRRKNKNSRVLKTENELAMEREEAEAWLRQQAMSVANAQGER